MLFLRMAETQFENCLASTLTGAEWARAHQVFRAAEPECTQDLANLLYHAWERGQMVAILDALEAHYAQHGRIPKPPWGVDRTRAYAALIGLFGHLSRDVLGLRSAAADYPFAYDLAP